MHPTVQPSTRATTGRHRPERSGRHAAESVDVFTGMRNRTLGSDCDLRLKECL